MIDQQLLHTIEMFDWRFLVPLLAIPLAIIFWPSFEDNSNEYYRKSNMIGLKGGRAKRTTKKILFVKKDKTEERRITNFFLSPIV